MAAKRVEKRLAWIRTQHGLDPNPPAGMTGHGVASLNSDEMRKLLKQLDPDVVAVYSTRILSRKTLAAVDAPLINYHAGFNPKYRRQHPAYWPLVAGGNGKRRRHASCCGCGRPYGRRDLSGAGGL